MTLVTSPGSGSAILTPDQVEDLVIQPLLATAVATRVSTITRTSSHNTRFPVVVADPVTDWTAEGEEIDVSEPDLTEVVVTPSKLAGLTVVSNELVADSDPSVLDIVGDGLVRDLQVRLDAAYFGNTTANAPSGLLSLADVQVISWGSITDLDPFAGSRAITNAPCCCVTLPPWLNLTVQSSLNFRSWCASATPSKSALLECWIGR